MRALHVTAIALASVAVGVIPAVIPAASSASNQHTTAGCPAHPANLAGQSLIQAGIGSADSGDGGATSLPSDLACADLRGVDLTQADLRGADLHGADLTGAKLGQAELTGDNLQFADLDDADLTQAELGHANLRNANLNNAGLSQATLSGADLRDADLDYVDLTQADLGHADLRGASLWLTMSIQAFSVDTAQVDAFGHGNIQISYVLLQGAGVLLLFRWWSEGGAILRARRTLTARRLRALSACAAVLVVVAGLYALFCGVLRLFITVVAFPLWTANPGPISVPGIGGMFVQAGVGVGLWIVGRLVLAQLRPRTPTMDDLLVDAVP